MIILKIVNLKPCLKITHCYIFHDFIVIIQNTNLAIVDSMHFEHAYILFERLPSDILFITCTLPFSKRNLRQLFLSRSVPALGSFPEMLLETVSHLAQNIQEESIYSVNIFFSVANQGHCFKKEPPPREKYLLAHGPNHLKASNLSPWG